MARLIDADVIREKLMEYIGLTNGFERAFSETPTIEIVRCKECKHNYNTAINHGKMKPRCDFTDYLLTENDFCSRGERRKP